MPRNVHADPLPRHLRYRDVRRVASEARNSVENNVVSSAAMHSTSSKIDIEAIIKLRDSHLALQAQITSETEERKRVEKEATLNSEAMEKAIEALKQERDAALEEKEQELLAEVRITLMAAKAKMEDEMQQKLRQLSWQLSEDNLTLLDGRRNQREAAAAA
jgi:hypothetical protein